MVLKLVTVVAFYFQVQKLCWHHYRHDMGVYYTIISNKIESSLI